MRIYVCKICKDKYEAYKDSNGFCVECKNKTKCCECGCHELIPMYRNDGVIRTVKDQSHRIGKLNSNYGNIMCDESRKSISEYRKLCVGERNSFYGKHHTEESINKIKLSMPDLSGENNPMYGIPSPMTGRNLTDEQKNKISLAHKGKKWSEEHKAMYIGNGNPMYGRKGESCPAWKGGKSMEPYTMDFNYGFKEMIRARQNYECADKDETCNTKNRKLDVHHVDMDKKNSTPENCIALCYIHHRKAHNEESRIRHLKYIKILMEIIHA